MVLVPGTRLRSAVDDTEVVVVRAPATSVTLRCGGMPMVTPEQVSTDRAVIDARFADRTTIGKRYLDDASGLEVLCIRAGNGSLSVDLRPLSVRPPKRLPASD